MFVKIPSRIGMNYFSYGNDIKRFIINKILFLTGAGLCSIFLNELLLYIATVVLIVPVVKKFISEAFACNFSSEATLIISETMLCIALERVDTVVFFLLVYHVFDALLYTIASVTCKRLEEKTMFCKTPVGCKTDAYGNYVLSNNEFVPVECVVLSGNAVIDTAAISGKEHDFRSVGEGEKLLPSYRVISGDLTVKALRDPEESLKKAIADAYSNPKISNNASANSIMSFSIGILSVILIVFTSVVLFGKSDSEWLHFSFAITSLLCVSPIFLFEPLFEYSYFAALAGYGIHIISPSACEDISVIEGDTIYSEKKIASFGYYSHYLLRSEANAVIAKKRKMLLFKNSSVFILFILNVAVFFVSVFTEMFSPSAVAVIASAFVVLVLSRIN